MEFADKWEAAELYDKKLQSIQCELYLVIELIVDLDLDRRFLIMEDEERVEFFREIVRKYVKEKEFVELACSLNYQELKELAFNFLSYGNWESVII